jgi:ribosomal subunit interface protein
MNIQFSFLGMEASDALRDFTTEKITKYEHLLIDATKISVDFKKNTSAKGVDNDFNVDINIIFPNSLIRVQENGSDMYAIVDKLSDILGRRIKKYHEKKNENDLSKEVLIEENIEDVAEEASDSYIDYVPKISKMILISDIAPKNEAEAIEKMELAQKNQILFKDISTGLVSMIYKTSANEYVLEALKREI